MIVRINIDGVTVDVDLGETERLYIPVPPVDEGDKKKRIVPEEDQPWKKVPEIHPHIPPPKEPPRPEARIYDLTSRLYRT
ncbi:hypothetical protein J4421_00495 [Candidatus Woesearchaeota archaeon]|nr:hypothetical protein [Candidatus Woesearchaeota archaeon]